MRSNLLILIVSILVLTPTLSAAQEEILPIEESEETAPAEESSDELDAKIRSEDFLLVDSSALFDASPSLLLPDLEPTYRWEFTDSAFPFFGSEVIRQFSSTGIHRISLTVTQGDQSSTVEKEIFVYDTRALLVTDKDTQEELRLLQEQAANNGVFLKILTTVEEETGFLTEERLVSILAEEREFMEDAETLIFYSDGAVGLQGFARYWNTLEATDKFSIREKIIVTVSDSSFDIIGQLVRQSYEVISPPFILLTRPEALNPIFENKEPGELTEELAQRGIEHRVVDVRGQRSPAFLLSQLVTQFVSRGIPTNTIYLLLAFPFIMFIITFARQVIGISTFGVYTPAMVALALLILGLFFGLGVLTVVVVVSTILRKALNRFNLLHVPRTSLVLSSIGLSFLAIIWILSTYELSAISPSLAIFPMLVMSTISEKFISTQSESGIRGAFFAVLRTIGVAVVAYFFVSWSTFTDVILSWPELVLVPLLLIVLLGRFTGLRFTEYFRFRGLFRDAEGTEE